MGLIKSALKTGIVVKLADIARREAAKPENQRKLRELADRVRREAAKPENKAKAQEMLSQVTSRIGKTRRTP